MIGKGRFGVLAEDNSTTSADGKKSTNSRGQQHQQSSSKMFVGKNCRDGQQQQGNDFWGGHLENQVEVDSQRRRNNNKKQQIFPKRVNSLAAQEAMLDWALVDDQILSYAQCFPHPCFPSIEEEKVIRLRCGDDFVFSDQFVQMISYGGEQFETLLVRNFFGFPSNFFAELFKHVVKTQFPHKMVPMMYFKMPESIPWPKSFHLCETPKHLEPKMISKHDLQQRDWVEGLLTAKNNELFLPPPNNMRVENGQQAKSTRRRVMYSLRNEATNVRFHVKMWYDPAQGDVRNEHINALTLRKEVNANVFE